MSCLKICTLSMRFYWKGERIGFIAEVLKAVRVNFRLFIDPSP